MAAMEVIALLVATLLIQGPDLEALNRLALAKLPYTRIACTSSLINPHLFATFTYNQTWYTYAPGSELYPKKFLGNEDGYLDLWRVERSELRHIKGLHVGQMIPGWNRSQASFVVPRNRQGAVFIADPPSAEVPLLEIIRVSSEKPFFKVLFSGLGELDRATVNGSTIRVEFRQTFKNKKGFRNPATRWVDKKRNLDVRF